MLPFGTLLNVQTKDRAQFLTKVPDEIEGQNEVLIERQQTENKIMIHNRKQGDRDTSSKLRNSKA